MTLRFAAARAAGRKTPDRYYTQAQSKGKTFARPAQRTVEAKDVRWTRARCNFSRFRRRFSRPQRQPHARFEVHCSNWALLAALNGNDTTVGFPPSPPQPN